METDDAHERRLTQVLLALALFLSYFDENKRSELTSQFKNIFDSGKFWKLDKIKSIQVIRISLLYLRIFKTKGIYLDSKFILSMSL